MGGVACCQATKAADDTSTSSVVCAEITEAFVTFYALFVRCVRGLLSPAVSQKQACLGYSPSGHSGDGFNCSYIHYSPF